jgi:hypothetical protein
MAGLDGTVPPTARRVLMTGEQVLVVDAVGAALGSCGFTTTELPFAAAAQDGTTPSADAGVLFCDPRSPTSLRVAKRIMARVPIPWVVVSSGPKGPVWDDLRCAGARDVVEPSISVARLATILTALLPEGSASLKD